MRLKRSMGTLLLSGGIGFSAVTGCGAGSEGTSESFEPVSVAGNGVSGTLTFQSDWTQGYCANVAVSNTGSTPTTTWQVVIDLNQSTISSRWSATSAVSGMTLTATPLAWNAAIAPGTSTTFGFCANATGTNYHPTLVSVSAAGSAGTGGSSGADAGSAKDASAPIDAAAVDATAVDAAAVDTGVVKDAASMDSAIADSSPADAGAPKDAAVPDVGPGPEAGTAKDAGTSNSSDIVINPGTVHQTMDGFGAADVWAPGGALSAAQAKLFFDPVNGIGLSILRVGIDVDGTILGGASAYSDVKLAASYGAIVWGAPWSPPAADKSNDSEDNGGTLDTSDYGSWASTLAGFAATLKAKTGVQLYGVSAQNEPDFSASYASCLYSSAQMVSFVEVLGPKLAALNPPVKLLAAEPDSWSNLWSGDNYGNGILGSAAASSAVNIIATHDYGHKNDTVSTRPSPPSGVTQHIWETEMSDETAPDVDITHGIQVATWVYAGVTTGGASAWHYWWLVNGNTDGEGLLQPAGTTGDINSPPKRLYTLGNFSKFVRPGYERIDVSGPVPSGVLIAAFKNPSDNTVAIVAINGNSSATSTPFFVSGTEWPSQVTPWVTSASANLAAQTPISLSGGTFTTSLAAQSVTTFVGKP